MTAPLFDHVWSDTHFGHANVIRYSDRPFASADEMDAALIAAHNERVRPGETVLWVGDVSFASADRTREILQQLNGYKLLVLGNHDRSAAAMARFGFQLVTHALTLTLLGRLVRVSHLPYRGMDSRERSGKGLAFGSGVGALPTWERRGAEEWLIHGHTHSRKQREGQAIHVGVDAWGYRPVHVTEVVKLMEAER